MKLYGGVAGGNMSDIPKLSKTEDSLYGLMGVLADYHHDGTFNDVFIKTIKRAVECIHELKQSNEELLRVWDNLVVGRDKKATDILEELAPAVQKISESHE